jgi:hypothetical protein
MTTETEHRCQNPKCQKLLTGRRADTKYCNPSCRYQAVNTAVDENGNEHEIWISSGCRYPRQQQAEIVPGDQGRRHPYSGSRPEWSGYCVIKTCECPCHPENKVSA